MKYVELARGRDYLGRGVKAYRGKPFSVADKKAEELVGSGFFRYSDVKGGSAKGRKLQTEALPDFGEGPEG